MNRTQHLGRNLAVFGSFGAEPASCSRAMIVRVALTDSCWPTTWKMSVPKASSGGSSSSQARGWNSGRASISLARIGSERRRNSRQQIPRDQRRRLRGQPGDRDFR